MMEILIIPTKTGEAVGTQAKVTYKFFRFFTRTVWLECVEPAGQYASAHWKNMKTGALLLIHDKHINKSHVNEQAKRAYLAWSQLNHSHLRI